MRELPKDVKKRKWKKMKCWECVPIFEEELLVSGFGRTEYNINFCKKCGRIIGTITEDWENLYSEKTT